jgi:fructokinase
MHAEMGHLAVRRDPRDLQFSGVCPFHGDCIEGLASGPAIRARWGCDLSALPGDHPGRAMIGGYLAQLAAAITLLQAPQVLVIGGGVLSDPTLLPLIRAATQTLLAGYLPHLRAADSMDSYIRAPALGGDSAITGAALMAGELLPSGPRG